MNEATCTVVCYWTRTRSQTGPQSITSSEEECLCDGDKHIFLSLPHTFRGVTQKNYSTKSSSPYYQENKYKWVIVTMQNKQFYSPKMKDGTKRMTTHLKSFLPPSITIESHLLSHHFLLRLLSLPSSPILPFPINDKSLLYWLFIMFQDLITTACRCIFTKHSLL